MPGGFFYATVFNILKVKSTVAKRCRYLYIVYLLISLLALVFVHSAFSFYIIAFFYLH